MSSIGFYMQFTVAVLSGFVYHATCQENHTQCFEVESKTICYFAPNVSSVNWDTAWKICRELNATLPVILNEKGQTVIGDYLNRPKYFPAKSVWTAGRYVGSRSDWIWFNGQDYSGSDKPACPRNESICHHETQSVLTKGLSYEARFPNNTYAFICSYPGVNCGTVSQKSIQWKGGCLSLRPSHRLRPNEARNECLKDGGDLVTFREDGNLEGLQALSSVMKDHDANEYWIGLHRKFWIWNVTDMQDIRYNLLDDYGDLGKDCLFLDERVKWRRGQCSVTKNVICQTAKERDSSTAPFPPSVAIGIVIALLSVAIIVMILLIFIRRRMRVAESTPNVTKTDPSTLPRNAIVQCTDDTYATIDDDDLENFNHKNNSNPCKDRLGNLSIAKSSKPNTTKSDPVTPAHKAIVQSTDDTYATIDLDDDVENLNYQNGPNPSTSYTKVELCDDPSAVYSELADVGASETERSTGVYAEPYVNSAVSPVSKTPVASPSDIYAEVNKPRLGKKSDELTSPPIKIGPQGDIYTLPISHN